MSSEFPPSREHHTRLGPYETVRVARAIVHAEVPVRKTGDGFAPEFDNEVLWPDFFLFREELLLELLGVVDTRHRSTTRFASRHAVRAALPETSP